MFLVFEGPDGSGKSTQVKLLKEYFESHGKKVFVRREPGGTYFGEKVRNIILKDKKSSELAFDSQLYLALFSYIEGLRETKKYLDEGYVVISDRLSEFSSHIYQGQLGSPKSPLDYDTINFYNEKARSFMKNPPSPDKIICLLPLLEETKKRADKKQRDFLDKINQDFENRYFGYKKLFQELVNKDPGKFILINQVDTPKNVFEIIKSRLF